MTTSLQSEKPLSGLEEICGIIDFDGFQLSDGRFLVREFGYVGITKQENPECIRFNLKSFLKVLNEKDFKTAHYVSKHIHGLPFKPIFREKVFSTEFLDKFIIDFYKSVKSPGKFIIAYKGGIIEKTKLIQLNIPSLNLENFDCPKYDKLYPIYKKDCDKFQCGYHKPGLHCSKSEVWAFKKWMLDQISI